MPRCFYVIKELVIFISIGVLLFCFSKVSYGEDFSGKITSSANHYDINYKSLLNKNNATILDKDSFTLEFNSKLYKNIFRDVSHLYFTCYGWYSPEGRKLTWVPKATWEDSQSFLQVNELYFDFQASKEHYFVLGRKRESWGNGFFWNPANIVDPEILYDRLPESQKGRFMLKYVYSLGESSFSSYIMPLNMEPEKGGFSHGGVELACKMSTLLSGIDVGAGVTKTVIKNDNIDKNSAASLWGSYAFPSNLTLFSEGAFIFQNNYLYPRNANLDEDHARQDETCFSLLLGANYLFSYSNIAIRGEYYRNGQGYTNTERKYYFDGLQQKSDISSLNKWIATYDPYLLSQDFLGISINYPDIMQVLDCRLLFTYGLNDQSRVFSADFVYHPLEKINFFFKILVNSGNNSYSEFKQQVTNYKIGSGVIIYF